MSKVETGVDTLEVFKLALDAIINADFETVDKACALLQFGINRMEVDKCSQ